MTGPLTLPQQRALEALGAAGDVYVSASTLPPLLREAVLALRESGHAERGASYADRYRITDKGRRYLATLHR